MPHTVTVGLGGVTIVDGNNKILIGQRCEGSLSVSPGPTGLQLTNYQWIVGGEYFDRFSLAADHSKGEAILVDTGVEFVKPNPRWVWKKDQADVEVTCTATASINGLSIGPVTGNKKVTVDMPVSSKIAPLNSRSYWSETASNATYLSAGHYNQQGEGSPAPIPDWWIDVPGVAFQANIATPAVYGSSGEWIFVQLIKGSISKDGEAIPALTFSDYRLDNDWPYDGPYPATSGNHDTGDAPATQINNRVSVSVADAYQMFVMYRPPATELGSEWVPIYEFDWTWTASGTRPNTSSPWSPDPPGTVMITKDARVTTHPKWTAKFSN